MPVAVIFTDAHITAAQEAQSVIIYTLSRSRTAEDIAANAAALDALTRYLAFIADHGVLVDAKEPEARR